jgi:hypothetical protein
MIFPGAAIQWPLKKGKRHAAVGTCFAYAGDNHHNA